MGSGQSRNVWNQQDVSKNNNFDYHIIGSATRNKDITVSDQKPKTGDICIFESSIGNGKVIRKFTVVIDMPDLYQNHSPLVLEYMRGFKDDIVDVRTMKVKNSGLRLSTLSDNIEKYERHLHLSVQTAAEKQNSVKLLRFINNLYATERSQHVEQTGNADIDLISHCLSNFGILEKSVSREILFDLGMLNECTTKSSSYKICK